MFTDKDPLIPFPLQSCRLAANHQINTVGMRRNVKQTGTMFRGKPDQTGCVCEFSVHVVIARQFFRAQAMDGGIIRRAAAR